MDWIMMHPSETLLYVTICIVLASMAAILSGAGQRHAWRADLKQWNALITKHVRKTAEYDPAVRVAFHDFELKRNAASALFERRASHRGELEAAMRDALHAWHRFDTLMQEYEQKRRDLAQEEMEAPS